MAQYSLEWLQYVLKLPNMTQNDLKCSKTVQYGLTWTKLSQNDPKWSYMIENGQKMISTITHNEPKSPKLTENVRK
jgi:hypothetical protein